jgi:hypothetical protein
MGFQPPHKACKITEGFSPGGTLSASFIRDLEFFRNLFSPLKECEFAGPSGPGICAFSAKRSKYNRT